MLLQATPDESFPTPFDDEPKEGVPSLMTGVVGLGLACYVLHVGIRRRTGRASPEKDVAERGAKPGHPRPGWRPEHGNTKIEPMVKRSRFDTQEP
jgi:hypothetical protein